MKNKLLNFWKEHKWFLIIIFILFPILILVIHLFIGLILDFIANNLSIKENPIIWLKTAFILTKVWSITLATLFIYVFIFTKWFKHKTVKPHTKEVETNDYGNAKWMKKVDFNQLFSQIPFNINHQENGLIVSSEKQEQNVLVNMASKYSCLNYWWYWKW